MKSMIVLKLLNFKAVMADEHVIYGIAQPNVFIFWIWRCVHRANHERRSDEVG